MKKYFAKYLPVEGEIKEGDKVFYTGKELEFPEGVYTVLDNVKEKMSVPSVPGYGIYHKRSEEELPNGKKKITGAYLKIGYNIFFGEALIPVKLFLCSRDIQAGDKIWNEFSKSFVEIGQEYIDTMTEEKAEISFKVIGEISSEAKWVKEGDEFDEYEEWWWNIDKGVFVFKKIGDKLDKTMENKSEVTRLLIKLKCPCCETFK